MRRTKRGLLSDEQVAMLMGVAADGGCPACEQMHEEWDGPGTVISAALWVAFGSAGCRVGRPKVTPERVLRALVEAGLAKERA